MHPVLILFDWINWNYISRSFWPATSILSLMSIFLENKWMGETVILPSINHGTTTPLQFLLCRCQKRPAIACYSSRADLTMMATIMQDSDNYSLCQPWHNNCLTPKLSNVKPLFMSNSYDTGIFKYLPSLPLLPLQLPPLGWQLKICPQNLSSAKVLLVLA
jgi:hypothetical protein